MEAKRQNHFVPLKENGSPSVQIKHHWGLQFWIVQELEQEANASWHVSKCY